MSPWPFCFWLGGIGVLVAAGCKGGGPSCQRAAASCFESNTAFTCPVDTSRDQADCNGPFRQANGTDTFCCGSLPVGCVVDNTLPCASPSTGFACPAGGPSPADDPNATCSVPAVAPLLGGALYCCSPSSADAGGLDAVDEGNGTDSGAAAPG